MGRGAGGDGALRFGPLDDRSGVTQQADSRRRSRASRLRKLLWSATVGGETGFRILYNGNRW